MHRLPNGFLDRVAQGRALRRWRRAGQALDGLPLSDLAQLRREARSVRAEIDRFLQLADAEAVALAEREDGIERPLGCDWTWRPEPWSGPVAPRGLAPARSHDGLGSQLKIFHDGADAELMLRQRRQPDRKAPFAVDLEVFDFGGSFLSLVVDLPEAALRGLRLNHLVRLNMDMVTERPLEVFCRLNITYGPNTEQLVREWPRDTTEGYVEFDLAYTRMKEKRLEKAWLDIIFEGARMNAIALRDVTLLRHPRAEL